MNSGQPAVSTKKTATAAARAGAVLVVALVALAASFSLQAATDPGRNELSLADAKVGDNAFHWIDATTVDPSLDLAEADAPPAQDAASRTAETAKPHDADKSPNGLDLIDEIQDWLARSNREYQTTIIPRLSTPSPDADAVARKREQIKEEEDKAAEAARRAEEARKADAARKAEARRQAAEAARKAAEEAKQAEAARKAAEEAKQAEAARKAAEEAKQTEEARKAAEEAKQAEAARKAAEEAKQAEAARKAAEEAKQAEAARKAAEEAKQAEAARKAAEEAKQAEEARKAAEEAKQAEEARKAAEEAKQAEEARKAAEEAKQAEAARKAAEEAKQAEATRKAAEEAKQAEEARKAAEEAKQAEAARKAAQSPGREGEVATPPPQPIPEPGSMQAQKLPGALLGSEPTPESDADLKESEPARSAETKKVSRNPEKRGSVRRWVQREQSCRLAGRHSRPPGHYIVRRGDSLWRISRYYYRRGWFYHRLYRANRRIIRDPDLIYPCQRIFVPRRR